MISIPIIIPIINFFILATLLVVMLKDLKVNDELRERLNKLEKQIKSDPYEKYRNQDGLLRGKKVE